jgi:hypothetical protein
VATDRPVNITLLHHVTASCVFRWNSLYRGGIDAGYRVETPRGETRMSMLCQRYSKLGLYRRMMDSTPEFTRMQLIVELRHPFCSCALMEMEQWNDGERSHGT